MELNTGIVYRLDKQMERQRELFLSFKELSSLT